MNVFLALSSENRKTGPMPVSTTSAETCPNSCPFKHNGCYAEGIPLRWRWEQVTEGRRVTPWPVFLGLIRALPEGQIWRHNQAGDLPGTGDELDVAALDELVAANAGRRGFTYTHKPLIPENVAAFKRANDAGFTINVSADSTEEADFIADMGHDLPLVSVLPADVDGALTPVLETPRGRKVSVCPAYYRDGVTCETCKLCSVATRRSIVGFPAHGPGKAKASAIAEGK